MYVLEKRSVSFRNDASDTTTITEPNIELVSMLRIALYYISRGGTSDAQEI
jgi:hypothetical protein